MSNVQTNDIKTSVQKQFNQVAANYSTSTVHAQGVDLAEMVKAARLTGREKVLDAGCGTGHTALTFAPHVAQVMAVDFTEGMLAQGRKLAEERQFRNIEFQLGDVEKLQFAAGEFDVVVSRYSAHHWPHPQSALREFWRVLRPGGQFILSDVVSFADFTADTFLQAIELLRDPSHVRDHTAAQWLEMLATTGFQAEVVFTWDVDIDFSAWVKRMATPAPNVTMIQTLFDGAPQEVRAALQVQPDYSFAFQGGLIRSVRV
ncbi:MAG: class I SAM-dependent methyltransferase [Caldilineaceae bacterium]